MPSSLKLYNEPKNLLKDSAAQLGKTFQILHIRLAYSSKTARNTFWEKKD